MEPHLQAQGTWIPFSDASWQNHMAQSQPSKGLDSEARYLSGFYEPAFRWHLFFLVNRALRVVILIEDA